MRIFLIRHGETVDNVAGVYAGSRDSALTTHGVIQATRLGEYLVSTGVRASHIFSSDLQRAFKTAEAIRVAQNNSAMSDPFLAQVTVQLPLLREQHFGAQEGLPCASTAASRASPSYNAALEEDPLESKPALAARAKAFVDDFLVPLHASGAVPPDYSVIVVSHGIFLGYLWGYLAGQVLACSGRLLPAAGVNTGPDAVPLHLFRMWSNTGYIEVEARQHEVPESVRAETATYDPTIAMVRQPSSAHSESTFFNASFIVHAINGRDHLQGLKKTRGGIGSAKHDASQKTLDSFFKKR